MTTSWKAELATIFGPVATIEPVSGGDINLAWRVELSDGRSLFVKTNATAPPGMYAAEAAGLAWIGEGPLRVPRVIVARDAFLALEWLDLGARGRSFDAELGRGLAGLHRLGAPAFGHTETSFLATFEQDNTAEDDVVPHWIERRVRPLCTRAKLGLDRQLDALARRRDRFGPPEPPARLHGDLWSGNVVVCGGAPVLIDPAVYGGHREVDLAMLALFGSVSDTLLDAYSEIWPLEPGWRERVPLWQLYPLAAHAVLFGGGYGAQVARILDDLT